MLKKAILFPVLLLCFLYSNAQINDNVRLDVEPEFMVLTDFNNGGVFLNIEPKVKIAQNTYAGLRIGIVSYTQEFKNNDPLQYQIDENLESRGISFVPTIDHHFYEKHILGKFYRPYLGLGAGAYLLSRRVDVTSTVSKNQFEVEVDKQIGVLIRAGLESHRLRLGLEYNLIQKADIELPNGQLIGIINNSYLGVSVGIIISRKAT